MAKRIANLFNQQIKQKLAQTLRDLPAILGEEAVNFSLQSFEQEAWSGFSQEVWAKRKNPTKWGKKDDAGRAVLVKTGRGKRSIRVGRIMENKAFIVAGGAEAPYMRAHNFGFRGQVVQQVQPFTRKMQDGSTQNVKAFTRTINQNLPKRMFIGGQKQSPYLKARLKRVAVQELRYVFRK